VLLRQTSALTEEHVLPKHNIQSPKVPVHVLISNFPASLSLPSHYTIVKNMEPAKSKNETIIARAKDLVNVPWCEEYEKMISGML
jgi:hypothetical protein